MLGGMYVTCCIFFSQYHLLLYYNKIHSCYVIQNVHVSEFILIRFAKVQKLLQLLLTSSASTAVTQSNFDSTWVPQVKGNPLQDCSLSASRKFRGSQCHLHFRPTGYKFGSQCSECPCLFIQHFIM